MDWVYFKFLFSVGQCNNFVSCSASSVENKNIHDDSVIYYIINTVGPNTSAGSEEQEEVPYTTGNTIPSKFHDDSVTNSCMYSIGVIHSDCAALHCLR